MTRMVHMSCPNRTFRPIARLIHGPGNSAPIIIFLSHQKKKLLQKNWHGKTMYCTKIGGNCLCPFRPLPNLSLFRPLDSSPLPSRRLCVVSRRSWWWLPPIRGSPRQSAVSNAAGVRRQRHRRHQGVSSPPPPIAPPRFRWMCVPVLVAWCASEWFVRARGVVELEGSCVPDGMVRLGWGLRCLLKGFGATSCVLLVTNFELG